MSRLRITLAGSLGIVAVIAMGLAGMVSASGLWTTAAATVTFALLLTALLATRFLDGMDRAFWAGFALFGWSYLVLVNWDWIGGPFGHDLTAGLSDLAEAVFPDVPVTAVPPPPPQSTNIIIRSRAPQAGAAPPGVLSVKPVPPPATPAASTTPYLQRVRERQIKLGNFVQIGRMFLSLAFGLLGGWIAQALARRRELAASPAEPARSVPAGRDVG